jgi:hypothetical protein
VFGNEELMSFFNLFIFKRSFCNLNVFIEPADLTINKIISEHQLILLFKKIFFILEESSTYNFQVYSRKEFDANEFFKLFKLKPTRSILMLILFRNCIPKKYLRLVIDALQKGSKNSLNDGSFPKVQKEIKKKSVKIKDEAKNEMKEENSFQNNYYFLIKNFHIQISLLDDKYFSVSIYEPYSQKKETYYFSSVSILKRLLRSKSEIEFEKILKFLLCFKNFIVGRKIKSFCNQTAILPIKAKNSPSNKNIGLRKGNFKKNLRKILNGFLMKEVIKKTLEASLNFEYFE